MRNCKKDQPKYATFTAEENATPKQTIKIKIFTGLFWIDFSRHQSSPSRDRRFVISDRTRLGIYVVRNTVFFATHSFRHGGYPKGRFRACSNKTHVLWVELKASDWRVILGLQDGYFGTICATPHMSFTIIRSSQNKPSIRREACLQRLVLSI